MTDEYVRKMATVQIINGIYPIEGADKICQYGINGWLVIDQVGKYKVGDLVVFLEIDSWAPHDIAPFLSKGKAPKIYQQIPGQRLKTIKLRGAISQGLILPFSCLAIEYEGNQGIGDWKEGEDVSGQLGVEKWEPPPEFTSADAKGTFPKYCPKSDQERIQNCLRSVEKSFVDTTYEVTEKIEGQSHSAILYNGEFLVCSRNLSLKDSDNTFWNTARKYDLEAKLRSLGRNLMIQSEQCGPGISGNIYSMSEYYLFVYDIYDIDAQEFLNPYERRALVEQLDLVSVPILYKGRYLYGWDVKTFLDTADGGSVLGPIGTRREGLVFKANSKKRISFKAVSNLYLLGLPL